MAFDLSHFSCWIIVFIFYAIFAIGCMSLFLGELISFFVYDRVHKHIADADTAAVTSSTRLSHHQQQEQQQEQQLEQQQQPKQQQECRLGVYEVTKSFFRYSLVEMLCYVSRNGRIIRVIRVCGRGVFGLLWLWLWLCFSSKVYRLG